jgi:carboxypeptidase PM20D1
MQILFYILMAAILVIIILAVVVLARTFSFRPAAAPPQDASDLNPGSLEPEVLERLSAAIRIPTLSNLDYAATDFAPFAAFREFLQGSFPLFHQYCERTIINGHALVYRWPGSATADGITALDPLALMAHYDVVPVEAGTEQDWQQPPFSGALADGFIWGRGTLDIKSQVMAHLEATEQLMRAGFTPGRDIYFCYGHDEETGGQQGALKIVEHLRQRGLRFSGVLDEGGVVVTGAMAGVDVPMALIGVAEKGSSNYRFKVSGSGGHSSMPPQHTSLGLAARLITLIERQPLPLRLTPPAEQMLRNLAGQMGFVVRMAMANLWLFRPLLLKILASSPTTNAMVRTTSAVTMADASDACNVLPQATHFNVNVRILPGDTVEGVQRYFEGLIAQTGLEAKVEPILVQDPSPVSPFDSDFYRSIEQLIQEFYPSALTTPYLVMGGTDSRQFYTLSDNVLRFTPMHITEADRASIHNTNEAISVENYGRMIAFYQRLLQQQ